MVKVVVRNDNIKQALGILKKKTASEGLVQETKQRAHFENKTEVRKRKRKEAVKREKKRQAKERMFYGD